MATGAPMLMNMVQPLMHTDTRFLTLMQWLSPSYPLGSFAYSHGLERAVAAGWVHDGQSLKAWLLDLLSSGSGRTDAIWLMLGYQASDLEELMTLDAEARAFAASVERIREAAQLGAAFARTTTEVWKIDLPAVLLPLGVGYAARQQQLDPALVGPAYLQAFVANLIAAAQRLLPIGQTEGQRIVAELNTTCLIVSEKTRDAGLNDISSIAFLSDIASMQHETQQPRLFQT